MAVKALKRQDSAKYLDFARQGFQGLTSFVAKPLLAFGERILSFCALRRLGEATARLARSYARSPESFKDGAAESTRRAFSQAPR